MKSSDMNTIENTIAKINESLADLPLGHETTQEIKGVKHPFDDRAIVRAFSFPPAND